METNSKSDVKAKEAYVKVLAEEGFKDIEIISTPTDISASKNGTKYFFELKFTNQTEKYFGAATLTEWECAINNLENFFFVICRIEKNKWLFDKFSPKEFIGYSTIPFLFITYKIFFNKLGPEPEDDADPFEGIETDDINNYADLYDVPPPETDNEAKKLANQIRKWIQDGRPKP